MIHIFDIRIRNNSIQPQLIKQVELDEMMGDPINKINLLPGDDRMLIVHCRDNVIRGLEPPRSLRDDDSTLIYKRFFGPACNKYNVRSCVSPDGKFLVSGSEDGKLYLWDVLTEQPIEISNLEVNVKDMISDVAWNPQFNMIAVAGFGSDLPVILYVYEKSAEEIEDNYAGLMDDYKIPDHLVPHKEVISNLAYEVQDRY
jgi:FOG: WD40 repeat